jgi:hypothetical protein
MRWMGCLLALLGFMLQIGCNTRDETRKKDEVPNKLEAENNMNDEAPDPAKSGTYLRIGRFEEPEEGKIVRAAALKQAEVGPIVARHADRNRSGVIIRGKPPRDGNGTTLGFVEGIPIVLRGEGELHVPEGKFSGRFERLIKDLCVELGCSSCVQVGERSSSLIRFVPD